MNGHQTKSAFLIYIITIGVPFYYRLALLSFVQWVAVNAIIQRPVLSVKSKEGQLNHWLRFVNSILETISLERKISSANQQEMNESTSATRQLFSALWAGTEHTHLQHLTLTSTAMLLR